VKTYGVDVKKAKKETEFQQFYDAAGNPVARYIKGTPEYFEAVNNTDLRTDKPTNKDREDFSPYQVRDRGTGETYIVEGGKKDGKRVWIRMDTGEVVTLANKDVRTLGTDINTGQSSRQREADSLRSLKRRLATTEDPTEKEKLNALINQREVEFVKSNYQGGKSQERKFIDARTAYNVGTANVDRIFEVFATLPKTGAVQGLYKFKGAVADQFKQLPFYEEDQSMVQQNSELEGVRLESNIIDLAYALAKSVDPNGRISDQDFKAMLSTLAPSGGMDRNTIAAAVVEADSRIRRRMQAIYDADTSAQRLYSYQDLFKRGPVMIQNNIGPNNESAVGYYPVGNTFNDNGVPSLTFEAFFIWNPDGESTQ
jgi:hypothetical protein